MHLAKACTFGVVTTLLVAAGTAAAQPQVDDATRSSARRLGDEANALFDAGNFAAALDKYERVDALVHLPTVGVRAARCLVKLGRLVEGSERYLAVTRIQLAADALALHKEAQVQAESERAALLPRIPSVVIDAPADAEVTVDGKIVPAALLGASRAVDPGPHKIEARRGKETQSRDVKVGEGDTTHVTFAFANDANTGITPVPVAPDHGWRDRESSRGTYRTVGFVGLGLGAVGLGVGVAAGLSAMSKKSDLEPFDVCGPDLKCPVAHQADADSYNGLRHLSTAGFVAGGVLAAAGAVFLLTAPERSRPAAGPQVSPWVSSSGAGVLGSF